jgi:hypothetical protein
MRRGPPYVVESGNEWERPALPCASFHMQRSANHLPSPTRRLESLLGLIADFDRELQAVKRENRACAKDDQRVSVLMRSRAWASSSPS